MTTTVVIPARFDDTAISSVKELLGHVRSEPEVSIDFSRLEYSFPLPMLVIGAHLREFVGDRKRHDLNTTALGLHETAQVHSYLQHLGFFRFVGLNLGKDVGEAPGNSRYIPIQRLTRSALLAKTDRHYRPLAQVISEETGGLARVILGQESDSETRRAIAYSLREIVRNVFEHSGADECYLCAQKWYDGQVQIGIIDAGCGVLGSLGESYPDLDGTEAVKMAIRPGVSRIRGREELANSGNSGYGLYVLAELGRECGWFVLGSGDRRIRSSPSKYDATEPEDFPGTYVGLNLDTGITTDFRKRLQEIIYSGEVEARTLGSNPMASPRSRQP